MRNDSNLKSYLSLHLIVFIWGFTAVLGELISIRDASVVWYRMGLATLFLLGYLALVKKSFLLPVKAITQLVLVGLLIAIHWIFFFRAIDISNVSVTLAMFSTGAFFASILEPIFYKRKMLWYEILFGLIIVACLCMIMNVEVKYIEGMICALFSVFIGVMFTIFNGKLIQKHDSTVITLYEFFAGFIFVSIFLIYDGRFNAAFFELSQKDWAYLLLLSSVCTAYAFTASVNVMKRLSPYTVMLTTNLEPVYGIFLAFLIIGDSEKMSVHFYIVSVVIFLTVIANGVVKNYYRKKKIQN
jgi:drug/metabolite transporter (DMT)-like permease